MSMNIKKISGIYYSATPKIRTLAIEHVTKWSEEACINSFKDWINSYNSNRVIYFDREPNFEIKGEALVSSLNNFDYFFQIGANKYLLEVKCSLFNEDYTLKIEQLKRYRKVLEENEEINDYILIFTSLFGGDKIYQVSFSELIGIDWDSEFYRVPKEILSFIDEDFHQSKYEKDLAKNRFLKRLGYKKSF